MPKYSEQQLRALILPMILSATTSIDAEQVTDAIIEIINQIDQARKGNTYV